MVHNLMAGARAFGGGDFLLAKFALRGNLTRGYILRAPYMSRDIPPMGERYLTGPSYSASKSPACSDGRPPPAALSGWKLRLCDEI